MKKPLIVLVCTIFMVWWFSLALNYSAEQQSAYNYAYTQKITTVSSIEKANMNGSLTRIAMAKMMSNFAINVLWLQPDTSRNCSFSDVSSSLDAQYNYWVTQACQLWLMWIWNDWNKSNNFNPYGTVTRAQFATAFSRALSSANWDAVREWEPYYKRHLQYLKGKWIIKDVNSPTPYSIEKRWNVMIMMYRCRDENSGTEKNLSIEDWREISYYDNWKLQKVVNFKNGELNWQYVEYYEDGSVKSEWTYKDWELDGYAVRYCEKWKEDMWYYRDGKCITWEWNYENWEYITWWPYKYYYDNWKLRIEWNKNKDWELDWDYVSYYENGQIEQKWQYKNGKKTWKWIEYFENGEVQSKWSYKNGEYDWYWIVYFGDGSIQESTYKDWKLEKSIDKKYYENWRPQAIISRNGDNELDWEWIVYYENGKIEEKWQYKNGKKTWEWIVYYDNGQIEEKWQYKNDKKTWEWIEYYKDGSIASKWSYKDWELDGYWIRYCEKWDTNCISLDWNYKNWEKIWD